MTLHLKVKPGSKVDQLFYDGAGQLTVKIKASAQEGRANRYLVGFLAEQFGVAKSKVTIAAGFSSSFKRIEIDLPEDECQVILVNS